MSSFAEIKLLVKGKKREMRSNEKTCYLDTKHNIEIFMEFEVNIQGLKKMTFVK